MVTRNLPAETPQLADMTTRTTKIPSDTDSPTQTSRTELLALVGTSCVSMTYLRRLGTIRANSHRYYRAEVYYPPALAAMMACVLCAIWLLSLEGIRTTNRPPLSKSKSPDAQPAGETGFAALLAVCVYLGWSSQYIGTANGISSAFFLWMYDIFWWAALAYVVEWRTRILGWFIASWW